MHYLDSAEASSQHDGGIPAIESSSRPFQTFSFKTFELILAGKVLLVNAKVEKRPSLGTPEHNRVALKPARGIQFALV
ncbi:hypothetical protein ACPOL_3260 [Acidisarcina polymorpha]|uniref:Uncharacterized protein n=1 Tax=Acidisarcina polymorpha TaxID=2211140 RepID=A0A2Z5G059_9BACT|nr:hypothetical protein ACPOL_3260 [Acidisarcina polymorpha]